MLRTEEEAKEIWCPFARVAMGIANKGDVPSAANRVAEVARDGSIPSKALAPFSTCIGSRCMAWRMIRDLGAVVRSESVLPGSSRPDWANGFEPSSSGSGGMGKWVQRAEIWRGYCGLAGNPE